ncbi:hypothetical protein [Gaetbulibacter sp. PBL-D1]|uniref:hypothetical protein n=1 Tax=Gaetbulibacter sp. PBL-D1 TaxID=3422594 RepID=UPI003D2EDAF0
MKIHYKKKQITLNLILGLVWLANGVIQTIFNDNTRWFDYIWFLLSGFYLITYFYQTKEKYLTIGNGFIKQNWPFGKKIYLNEITRIKHFAGEYILKTTSQEMKINIDLIDKESLSNLKTELEKLNVEWV